MDWGRVGWVHWSSVRSSQHNETRHATHHPLPLSTRQTSTTVTSTNGVSPSLNKYIQRIHDTISIHPYNNVHIYCWLYVRIQTPTDHTGNCNTRKILLHNVIQKYGHRQPICSNWWFQRQMLFLVGGWILKWSRNARCTTVADSVLMNSRKQKTLVLHSSHFALNWRCCTAVR